MYLCMMVLPSFAVADAPQNWQICQIGTIPESEVLIGLVKRGSEACQQSSQDVRQIR